MAVDSFLSVRGLSKSFAAAPRFKTLTFSLERGPHARTGGAVRRRQGRLWARCLAFFETPTSGEIWLDGLQRSPCAPISN